MVNQRNFLSHPIQSLIQLGSYEKSINAGQIKFLFQRTLCHISIFSATCSTVYLQNYSLETLDFIQINSHFSKLKAKTISFIEVEEKFVNILKIKLNCVNFCSHNINFVRIKMKLIICSVSRQVLIIHNSNNADCHHSSSRC